MSFLGKLFGARRASRQPNPLLDAAIAAWQAIPPPDLKGPLTTQRWLVVDVETSGLDVKRDHLLAIGAIVMDGNAICFDQSFEVVLKQAASSSTENILIHRIGGEEQRAGVDRGQALTQFLVFAQKLPCVAFHAAFDEAMLKRAIAECLVMDFNPRFIDLALLAPALVGDTSRSLVSLDDWVAHFSISIAARHRAVSDALGTAQLFQILLNQAATQGLHSADALFRVERDQRWLSRAGLPGM